MKILVAYDGTLNSKTAMRCGIRKVEEGGGELVILYVFNSAVFIDYDSVPKAQEMARIEAARHIEDARQIIERAGGGLQSRIIVREGDPAEELVLCAKSENADIIFSPPRWKSIIKRAPCPVSIIPGTILVPLDNTGIPPATIERIADEAGVAASKVILLGIVPIHIYGRWEKREIEKVKREVSSVLRHVKKQLNEKGIETKEIIRSGYPDEEILEVAGEIPLTMILMPTEGKEPSEVLKAAAIILDEPRGLRCPVRLIQAADGA